MVDFDYSGCLFGSVITYEEECREVATTLGASWEGAKYWSSGYPPGCLTNQGQSEVYFNTGPAGGKSTSYASVCEMGGETMHILCVPHDHGMDIVEKARVGL